MKKIIIVEDEELLSQVYKDALEKEGYGVLLAKDGAATLKELENVKPDLVMLDVRLPDINGLDLVDAIKAKYADVPVVLCTAYDSAINDFKKKSTKVTDYIIKPVALAELKFKIRKIIG